MLRQEVGRKCVLAEIKFKRDGEIVVTMCG